MTHPTLVQIDQDKTDLLQFQIQRLIATMSFGHKFRNVHFPSTAKGYTCVNHGSYGMIPQVLIDKLNEYTNDFYSRPDAFINDEHKERYKDALKAIAKVINCRYQNLALVTGDTLAVNTVLRSLTWEKGDKVVMANTTYAGCDKTFQYLVDTLGIEVIVLDFDFPISHDEILVKFIEVFENQKVKMAFFDTVSSCPSIKYPFAKLSKLCYEYGVLSFIDAAHGIGLLPLDFEKLDYYPDFLTTNLHKWFSLPYAFSVLYVNNEHRSIVQSIPITATYKSPKDAKEYGDAFVDKFEQQSRMNWSKVPLVKDAIQFRNDVCGGEERIFDYCMALSKQIGDMVEKKWPGAKALRNEDDSLDSAMISFYAPPEVSSMFASLNLDQKAGFFDVCITRIIRNYKTHVQLFPFKDRVCWRFSAQIYNELEDFEYSLVALMSTLKDYFDSIGLPDIESLKF